MSSVCFSTVAARAATAIGLAVACAPAQAAAPRLEDLTQLSVEELSRITVVSVSRREERLSHAAAAIFVITGEDIRRSGATSLPEALRLAPNLQVARADANQYAISARGFNNTLANKMLVMIDGRTVYSPLFSGVFWEAQHVMLEDVERIEVISGPGATQWGANAVNGVISVITRRARETQGTLAAAGAGNRDAAAALRHGGALGESGHYRVYGMGSGRGHTRLASGVPVMDDSKAGQAGFRADWTAGGDRFTLQGDAYRGDVEQAFGGSRDLAGANLVARWDTNLAPGSHLNVQAYYDRTERDQPGAIRERLDTLDVELHHGFEPLARHRALWGAGYRAMRDDLENLGPLLAFVPASRHLHRAFVYAQDEIALAPDLALTLGLKFERNDYTGWEALPSARLGWRLAPGRLLWTAASRAVRAPSRVDRELQIRAPGPSAIAGGPGFQSEIANVFEVGYRAQPRPALSYSISLFYNDYDRLRSIEPQPGGAVIANRMEGMAAGVNAWASYRVGPAWRLSAGGRRLNQKLALEPGSASLGGTAAAGNDPTHSWQVRSSHDLTPRHELDIAVRRVGALPDPAVPAFTALDVRVAWKVSPAMEISLSGMNLLDPSHPEWGAPAARAEIERSWFLKVLWRM